ncbi:HNH endonuclease [Bradyrhizobium sp. CCGUVB14]|uniref:HNH endonuclease n=1 Tax=Bradyrhizobium sp. CCGUVB14 TaxID=2949628 RepID=UPI0035C0331D
MDCRNARGRVRAAREKRNGGTHTEAEWQELLARTPRCQEKCNRLWSEIPPRPDRRYKNVWTKGHKVSVYAGGTNNIENIQPECYRCNFRKNAGRLGARL